MEGQIENKLTVIIGATGKEETRSFLQPLDLSFGNNVLTHEFLYLPECPIPLLGHNL